MTTHTANIVRHMAELVNPAMDDTDLIALAIAVEDAARAPEKALEAIGTVIASNGVTVRGAERVASYLARILSVDAGKLRGRPRKPFPALFRAARGL